jgi:hypothetical protein
VAARDQELRAQTQYSEKRGTAALWFAFLGGAVAWKLQLMVNYALVPYACWHGLMVTIHIASAATFALALAAGIVGLSIWRAVGGYPRDHGGYDRDVSAPLGRSRFLGATGAVMSFFFALVIFAQWVPGLFLSPCFGIQ